MNTERDVAVAGGQPAGIDGQDAGLIPGTLIAGKYRVERVLGEGGMGVVVAATHLDLNQLVAIKFLHPRTAHHPEVASRFMREARAAVSVRSEHIARVLDVAKLDDGRPYMVMEYLEGRDLSQVISRGPLPVPRAVEYVLHACAAMAAAHRMGIVHRDLKPANLFLTQLSEDWSIVKVLDFGISKNALDASAATLTNTSVLVGSPLYMSPEQMTSARQVDLRSDIWSLGAVLFELLSGTTPFTGDSVAALAAAILVQEPASLRQLRPDVPAALESVVLHALRKQPAERYQNVLDLAYALAPFASPEAQLALDRVKRAFGSLPPPPLSQGPLSLPPPVSVGSGATAATWTGSASAPASARKFPLLLPLVGTLIVGAAAAALFLRTRAPDRQAMPSVAAVRSEAAATAGASMPAARSAAAAIGVAESPPRPAAEPAVASEKTAQAPASRALSAPPPPRPHVTRTTSPGAPTRHLPPATSALRSNVKNPLNVQLK